MQFDIAKLDILTASEAGRPLTLLHPTTGLPFTRADGRPVTITLLGRSSAVSRACQRAVNTERAALDADGRTPTPEQIEAWDVRFLVEHTVAWTFDQLDGVEFPFNAENAQRFWADRRFMWLRGPAFRFVNEDGNFLAG